MDQPVASVLIPPVVDLIDPQALCMSALIDEADAASDSRGVAGPDHAGRFPGKFLPEPSATFLRSSKRARNRTDLARRRSQGLGAPNLSCRAFPRMWR